MMYPVVADLTGEGRSENLVVVIRLSATIVALLAGKGKRWKIFGKKCDSEVLMGEVVEIQSIQIFAFIY